MLPSESAVPAAPSLGEETQVSFLSPPSTTALTTESEILSVKEAMQEMVAFWPFVLRIGIITGFGAAESYVIAQKEIDFLGAYAAYESVNGLAIGLLYSSIFPVVTLMSDAKGEEEEALKSGDNAGAAAAREKIGSIWRQGIIFASLLSLPAVIFGLTASPLFTLFKQSDLITENSRAFMMYSTPGFVADIFYRLTARTVSGLGVRKSILTADVLDHVVELGLIYGFLHGTFGLPNMGLPGIGLAYSISKALTVLGHLLYMAASPACLKFDYQQYHLFKREGEFFNKEIFKKLAYAGIPDGMSSVMSGISSMLVVMFCGQSGSASLVGVQVATLYNGFANFHMSAVLNAACNKIGGYHSRLVDEEHKYTLQQKIVAIENVKIYLKLLLAVCVMISLLAFGLAFLIPRQLAALLIDKDNSAHHLHLSSAVTFLEVQGMFELMNGVKNPLNCVLDAFLDNRFVMITTVLFDLVCNPAAAAAMHYGLKKDPAWVYAASGVGSLFMMLAFMWRCSAKVRAFSEMARTGAFSPAEGVAVSVPAEEKSTGCLSALKQLIWKQETSTVSVTDPRQPLLPGASA